MGQVSRGLSKIQSGGIIALQHRDAVSFKGAAFVFLKREKALVKNTFCCGASLKVFALSGGQRHS